MTDSASKRFVRGLIILCFFGCIVCLLAGAFILHVGFGLGVVASLLYMCVKFLWSIYDDLEIGEIKEDECKEEAVDGFGCG